MAELNATTAPPILDEQGEYVWARDARKLSLWYRAVWISIGLAVASLVLPLGDALAGLFGIAWLAVFVTAIGAVVYTYRVQVKLKRAGFARTDPAFIIIGAVLMLLPVALVIAPAVRSNARKAARRIEQGGA